MTILANIKWQIHAETSITNALIWIVIWKLFGGWVGYLAFLMILGNAITMISAYTELPKKYLSHETK